MCLFILHMLVCVCLCSLIWHTSPVSPVLGSSSDLALLLVLQLLQCIAPSLSFLLPLFLLFLHLLLSCFLTLPSLRWCRFFLIFKKQKRDDRGLTQASPHFMSDLDTMTVKWEKLCRCTHLLKRAVAIYIIDQQSNLEHLEQPRSRDTHIQPCVPNTALFVCSQNSCN